MSFIRVDFPQPDGPTMAANSPWLTERSRRSRASTPSAPGYLRLTSSTITKEDCPPLTAEWVEVIARDNSESALSNLLRQERAPPQADIPHLSETAPCVPVPTWRLRNRVPPKNRHRARRDCKAAPAVAGPSQRAPYSPYGTAFPRRRFRTDT